MPEYIANIDAYYIIFLCRNERENDRGMLEHTACVNCLGTYILRHNLRE